MHTFSLLARIGFLTCLALELCRPVTGTADQSIIDSIARDFKPTSGYVVMERDGEWIIDLDQQAGISIGDIFSVIKPGEKIIHPVTQQVIGTLEEVKGVIKVTRMDQGFSFSRPLTGKADIKRADPIHRYGNLPATFWDYTGNGQQLCASLQTALPSLKWRSYTDAQTSRPIESSSQPEPASGIFFILKKKSLEVRDPEFNIIRSYSISDSMVLRSVKPDSSPAPSSLHDSSQMSLRDRTETGRKQQFTTDQPKGKITGAAIMADFASYREELLLAATDGRQISIYEIAGGLNPVVEAPGPLGGKVLALKWWQPDGDDAIFLTAVNWKDDAVSGSIYEFKNNSLVLIEKSIWGILGTFDMNGDGRYETLLSQEFDAEMFFGRRVKEIKRGDGEFIRSDPPIPLPRRFTVLGSMISDLTGDGQLETIFTRNGILHVYSARKLLYATPKKMGGSLSSLTYAIDPTAKNLKTTSVFLEISPVAADCDGDGQLEIIATASEPSFLSALKIAPGVKKSWLAIIRFRDGDFALDTLGHKMPELIQGLAVVDHQALLVTSEPGSVTGETGESHLLTLPLIQ